MRPQRPRVVDEIRHGLWFFEQSLLDAAELLAAYREAVPGGASALLRNWIGGGMDGNPAAGAETVREALARGRALALARYRAGVRDLAAALGLTATLVGVSDELPSRSRATSASCPAYAEEIGDQNRDEPYRRKLSFVWWRLGNDGYEAVEELEVDLDVIDRSLRAHSGERIADGRLATCAARWSSSASTWQARRPLPRRSSPEAFRVSRRLSARSPRRSRSWVRGPSTR